MPDPTPMEDFLSNVGLLFTQVVNWIVAAGKAFIAEPGIGVMLFFMPIVGIVLGYMLKIIGRKRGRGRR